MSENHRSIREDEIDLIEMFLVLWNKKLIIILITGLVSIGSIFYSLSLPNIYKSQAIISSASSSSGNLSSTISQYSGLADMAGISLPAQGGSDKFSMGLEVIKSLSFFEKLINKFAVRLRKLCVKISVGLFLFVANGWSWRSITKLLVSISTPSRLTMGGIIITPS